MCSACLRRTKRETKPSFYLGTCYSEMSRRVKTFDNKRPNYYGKNICIKEDFMIWFIDDFNFLTQYQLWRENNYQRKYAPSIDRIDNTKGYSLDNLRFISQAFNSIKDKLKPIKIISSCTGEMHKFNTTTQAAAFLGAKRATIKKYKNSKKHYKGWKIHEIT